jgi:hypothetical protein
LAARFGLAAVAENQGKWDEAKKQYEAIANAPQVLPSMKALANTRLGQVDELRKPLFTSPATAPAATAPATTGPAATVAPAPTTAPTTAPAL